MNLDGFNPDGTARWPVWLCLALVAAISVGLLMHADRIETRVQQLEAK